MRSLVHAHTKGYGLFVTKDVSKTRPGEGSPILDEMPIAFPPYLESLAARKLGNLCLLCAKTISPSPLSVACDCGGQWCNKLCRKRDSVHTAGLSCTYQTAPYNELLNFGAEQNWRAPLTLYLLWARTLEQSILKKEAPNLDPVRWNELQSFATLAEDIRASKQPTW